MRLTPHHARSLKSTNRILSIVFEKKTTKCTHYSEIAGVELLQTTADGSARHGKGRGGGAVSNDENVRYSNTCFFDLYRLPHIR